MSMKIGVILGSIRESRSAAAVVAWVMERAAARDGAVAGDEGIEYVQLDLRDYSLLLDTAPTPPMAANRQYEDPNVTRWSEAIDACDGFVFVTPEYNRSVPAAFKNAVDILGPEWSRKPVGFVGYGSVGGSRAIEHWRQIITNFSMPDVRNQVGFLLDIEFPEGQFTPLDRREGDLEAMLTDLEELVARRHA